MTDGIVDNHAQLAALSSNSRQAVVDDAGHEIHLFRPPDVIQAIQEVSMAVTRGGRLRSER